MNLSELEQTDGLSDWLYTEFVQKNMSKKVCKNLYGLSEFCTFSAPGYTAAVGQ